MKKIGIQPFGTTSVGEEANLYTIAFKDGSSFSATDYGASIVSCVVPDKDGKMTDVVLGYENVKDYEQQDMFMGSVIGRHANRIKGASFTLNEKEYRLCANEGCNHLHGGNSGFQKKLWKGESRDNKIIFSLFTPHMEEGYPGSLQVSVIYSFTKYHTLHIDYTAVCDQDTIINLTNHAYFNLAGHDAGNIQNHFLKVNSDFYTPGAADSVPTGEIMSVEGTPFDFREEKQIGKDINKENQQLEYGCGYDHNFVLAKEKESYGEAARAWCSTTGISLIVETTLPGMQLYSGNHIHGEPLGKNGTVYHKRDGFCLEAHFFPSGLTYSHFPQPILRKGEIFRHRTTYSFGIR
ncbi:aldose epimerase family protein [Anaerostipes hominis (ex Lee et al. 2021)]|uniref:Aldose 1-epimerase n=1 Tax=Anaerostipes hominis (ex Lee et al. 2021) TaxID=2025494 RepID=A0ABV4DNR0_9FIRM